MTLRHHAEALRWLAFTLAALALFRGWPALDLGVTGAVHDAVGPIRFPFGLTAPVQASYLVVPWLGRLALLAALVLGCWAGAGVGPRGRRRAQALLLVLVLGLWGVVNVGLKDHWGRPRPTEVSTFGGPHPFQPAGTVSPYCDKNCSFVSGHAATGFMLMAVGLLGAPATRRRWVRIGLVAGALIGAGRVLQGGHFLSDIVFAGLAMQGVCLLVRAGWVRWRQRRIRSAGPAPGGQPPERCAQR